MSRTLTGSSKSITRQAATKPQGTANTKNKPATSRKSGNGMGREEMISSIAAYFRAEHHGFDGGDPVADWLAAEAEIDGGI